MTVWVVTKTSGEWSDRVWEVDSVHATEASALERCKEVESGPGPYTCTEWSAALDEMEVRSSACETSASSTKT